MASDLVVVISGPSSAGKSTVAESFLRKGAVPEAFRVVTWTTRQPRDNERNGIDYVFVSEDEFRGAAESGKFLEWAFVHSSYYGSPRDPVLEGLRQNRLPILVLDVQGGLAIKKSMPRSVLVFLIPPSLDVLSQRILSANHRHDDLDVRLANAEWEMRHMPFYDYVITNDRLEDAVRDLEAVIIAERLRVPRRRSASIYPL